MNDYKVNNSNDDVTIEVNVSTFGIVSTRVNTRRPPSDFEVISKSTDPPNSNGKGRIKEKRIGQSKSIVGQQLQIDTIIRLDQVPSNDWQTIFNNLSIAYILRGGSEGEVALNIIDGEKDKTISGKTIRVIKEIRFIQS